MSPSGAEIRYARLEVGLFRLRDGIYDCELRYTTPKSIGRINPVRAATSLNPADLASPELSHLAYGQKLSQMLFGAAGPLFEMFGKVIAATQTAELKLRISIYIDSSAPDLNSLRWELLTAPGSADFLSINENILFSRYMTSDDWTPIPRRARGEVTSLVAVSAPPDLQDLHPKLAPVDGPLWTSAAARQLAGTQIDFLGRDEPLTIQALAEKLRNPIDILYLVCHGELNPDTGPALILQDDEGSPQTVPGADLVDRIRTLQVRPRLVLLVSCESAAPDPSDGPAARDDDGVPSLAARLAEAGVLAVVAMRGRISMPSMEIAMPVFLKQLMDDGQIDRAMAAARFAIRGRKDFWIPALYSRLEEGSLWYVPGFGLNEAEDFTKWKTILANVKSGSFVPILGPDINEPLYGDTTSLAQQLAQDSGFPLAPFQRKNLPQVAQFIGVDQDEKFIVTSLLSAIQARVLQRHPELPPEVREKLPLVWDSLLRSGVETYQLLAGLNASVYVTATQDSLLSRTLVALGRKPEVVVCDWRRKVSPSIQNVTPDTGHPLIYQALGSFNDKDSLVLTEDHFFDYMIATAQGNLFPTLVGAKVAKNAMFLLGFQLTDLSFRVLFRLIKSLEAFGQGVQSTHVGVQVNPNEHDFADVAAARAYLRKYCEDGSKITIYWGSALDFLRDLDQRLKKAGIEPHSHSASTEGGDVA